MKRGFLTAFLPDRSLVDIAAWAAEHGFDALEVAAWPDLGNRPFTATHLEAESFREPDAERVRTLSDDHGLSLSSLAFYDMSVEHEDPVQGGTEPRIEAGLEVARRTLRPLLVS